MTSERGWSHEEMAANVARDFESGWLVNLGTGLPTTVLSQTSVDAGVTFHSENGIVGMGAAAKADEEDGDLISAGKEPVTLLTGGAFVSHADSFAIVRGGHLDAAVMGAYQVSQRGDLANWKLPGDKMGSVGGAMDIALHAKRLFIIMRHCTKEGRPKLVSTLSYPLTAQGMVTTVFTDLATIDLVDGAFWLRYVAPGHTAMSVANVTEAELRTVSGASLDQSNASPGLGIHRTRR